MLFIIISSLCMVFPIIKVNANYCLTPSGYGLGVTDLNNCQGGTKYCATTGECIRTAICPKCEHGDVPEAKYFCTTNGKDECCTTPCAPQEMCEVPIKYESGDLNNDRCILSRAYCKSKDLCISSTDITCPICPDAKPYFCQLYGGGVCCDRLDESCTNYGPMCEPASSWSNGVYHNKCNDNERLCESKDLCISDSIDNKCPMCDVNKPLWCQRFGGGSCCDRLDENCVNYPRTTEEPVECGDNNNSGPRGPIQCTSDSDCCDGFNCKLDKAKCTPIRDAAVVANEVEEYHGGGGGGKKKPCYVGNDRYEHGEIIRDISQECVGWGAAARSFITKSEYCENGKVKTGSFENECYSEPGQNWVCCQRPGSKYVSCSQDECNFESEEGRKCYQFGREYADGEVVDFIGYQCEGWGAAQSQMSVTENVCRDGNIKYEKRDAPCANGWACCQMDRSAYCVPHWSDCPSNDGNNAALGIHSNVDYGSNTCYTLSGTGLGVTDYNKCAPGSGMNWCETTSECIRGATCPECKHDFADTIYCQGANGKEECCEGNECPSVDDDDICISPERYNSGIGGTNECDSGERFCSSTGECLASNAGNECPVCPSDKLSWCQLMGGGLCCKYIPDDQKCAWTYTYSSAKGLGSVSKKDKGNGNGNGSGSDTCCSATYDYFVAAYDKCDKRYCETTGECSSETGKTCPKCPSNKPNYCQLMGGGICCKNECPGSPEQPLCESVNTYDYYAFDYGKCAQGSGMKYCESTDECSRDTGKTCPKCPENKPYYRQLLGGGQCCVQKDVSNTYVNALSSGSNKDKTKDNIVEVLATATFSKSDSGVEGTVKIDENGNLFVDLDISSLDTSVCNFDKNQDVELEYALYDQFDYGDLKSRNGDECTKEVIGELYNPFNVPKCSEYNGNGDKYFECAIGDLSGRFGYATVSDDNKIKENGNISEGEYSKESGFCNGRLVPEEMYQRSVVFICNDSKKTVVFCAPFEVTATKLK